MISPKMQKISLIVIIVLLCIFVPLTGYGIFVRLQEKPVGKQKDNLYKEMYFDGKLWFYNEKGEILGTYTCETTSCSFGVSNETDEEYPIDSYKNTNTAYLPIVNNHFVFIHDSLENEKEAFLYDIQNEIAYKENKYFSVKNYQIGIYENKFIVENQNHQFGVIEISTLAVPIVSFDYDFIGVINTLEEHEQLLGDYFVAKKGSEWLILGENEAPLTKNINEPIVTFNGEYIITKNDDDAYHIKNYNGEAIIDEDFTKLEFSDKYLSCRTEDQFYIYDFVTNSNLSEVYDVKSSDQIEVQVNEETIDILINNRLEHSINRNEINSES